MTEDDLSSSSRQPENSPPRRQGKEVRTHRNADSTVSRNSQWCRSVVKHGGRGQSGQAIKLFQAPPKISFTFHFRHKSFTLDDIKLATTVLKEKCNILGGQNTLTLLHIFRGWRPPTPRIYVPGNSLHLLDQ